MPRPPSDHDMLDVLHPRAWEEAQTRSERQALLVSAYNTMLEEFRRIDRTDPDNPKLSDPVGTRQVTDLQEIEGWSDTVLDEASPEKAMTLVIRQAAELNNHGPERGIPGHYMEVRYSSQLRRWQQPQPPTQASPEQEVQERDLS